MAREHRLILVRHCQASGQEPDADLTDNGLRQAEALRDFLMEQPIDAIVTSEFLRARQSVEPLAAALELTPQIDRRLNERMLAAASIENWRDVLRDSFDDPDLRGPGGESAGEALTRARAALSELLEGSYQMPVAVTHGNLMSLVLHSLDDSFGYAGWESLSNPDVYLLENIGPGRSTFRRIWNEPHEEV